MDMNYGDTCTLSCRAPPGGTRRKPLRHLHAVDPLRPFFVGVSTIASCPSDNIDAWLMTAVQLPSMNQTATREN